MDAVTRGTCRVCGSSAISALPIGVYTRFFRLRVDARKDAYFLFSRAPLIGGVDIPLPSKVMKRISQILFSAPEESARQFRTFIQRCDACHTVTPTHEWQYEDLAGLYRDYRSEAYNRDRISVEPNYAKIVQHVGNHPQEISGRNDGVEKFLRRNEDILRGGAMLDFGGSDGRFLPPVIYERFSPLHIYDPSSAPLHPSVDSLRVAKVAVPERDAYDFVACMHVLEHVGNPRTFFEGAATYLRSGGVMYVEIPLELTDIVVNSFARRLIDSVVIMNEHINLFDMHGIPALAASLSGFEMIDVLDDQIDIGWAKARVGRFLVRKSS